MSVGRAAGAVSHARPIGYRLEGRSTEEIDRIAEAHFEAAMALIVSHEEHE